MDLKCKDGWIEVICGSMFAGKTEELIRRVNRIHYAKKSIIVFKPKIDNRYDEKAVVSHSNKRIDSIPVSSSSEVLDYINELPYAVAFDEAQFFDRGLINIIERLANSGVRVIVAGLDMDFRGEPFGVMPTLLAKAEFVTKLSAACKICGKGATRTQRIIDGKPAYYEDPIIVVGANECYEARCRCHHEVPHRSK